ncbi:MAG: threonine ammonia-lyase [Alphaproteobacteria bacterium]
MERIPVFADVHAAAERLKGVAVLTPLVESPLLSARTGGRVFLKLETLQRTGSFKFRGAYNRISQLTASEREKGVVAFSSGNHAQGIAAAAQLFGICAVIVMPSDAPRIKLDNTRGYGAEIVFYDRGRDNREEIAARIAAGRGSVVVPSFDDPHIVSGQGTVGLELAAQSKESGVALDNVLAPCSGGGLASGIALALSVASPATRVVTVEPEGFDGTRLSLKSGQRMAASGGRASIADALMSAAPGHIPFAILRAHKATGVAVSDESLMEAVGYAARELKLVAEPGGAAGLAAVLSGAFEARGKTIAIVISGGNIDPVMLVRCLGA